MKWAGSKMKYKITKEKVIEALINEPLLRGGSFFRNRGTGKDDGKCPACAVGTILRATEKLRFSGSDAWGVTGEICTSDNSSFAWESGNFMSILSCEFESADGFEDEHLPRFHALMVAEGICPDVLEFEV
jgi:hypothetical protein